MGGRDMLRGKGNLVFLLALMVGLLAPGFGRAAEIKLKTKRTIKGEVLLDTKERVVVKLTTQGTVVFTRDQIEEIIYTKEEMRKKYQVEFEKREAGHSASDPQERYDLACWCIKRQLWEEAADQLEEAVELKEDFFDAYAKLGEVQLELGQHTAAVKSWEKTLTLKPDDEAVKKKLAKAYGQIGKTLISQGKYAEALRLLRKVNKDFPLSKKMLAKMEEAEGYVQKADEHFEAGERAFYREDYVEARKEYKEALELNAEVLERVKPHLMVCSLKLGDSAYAEKKYREAVGYFEDYVNVQPELVALIGKLCDVYVELGLEAYRDSDFQEAARFLGQSVALRPSDPAAHFYLALVYSQQGKYKQALREATQAVQRSMILEEARNLEAEMDTRMDTSRGKVAPPTDPKSGGKGPALPRPGPRKRTRGAPPPGGPGRDPIMDEIMRHRNRKK